MYLPFPAPSPSPNQVRDRWRAFSLFIYLLAFHGLGPYPLIFLAFLMLSVRTSTCCHLGQWGRLPMVPDKLSTGNIRATPTLLFYCSVASFLMSSRNVFKVHIRLFFLIWTSIIRVTGQNYLQKLSILNTAFKSPWSHFLQCFHLSSSGSFPVSLRSLLWLWLGSAQLSLVCCAKRDTFFPLTNGEKRRRIMFQPVYSASIDLCWYHIDFYRNPTELLIHIQLVAIPSSPVLFVHTCFSPSWLVAPDNFSKAYHFVLALLNIS